MMVSSLVILLLLLVPVMYFMLREATYDQRTPEQRAHTYDGWFTGGSWNTGWYGPGTDFGIGPPPPASCAQ